jgi:NADH-quinone oxidoreductase subunit A
MNELQVWQLVLYGLLVLLLMVAMLSLAFVLGERHKPGRAGREPYESGIPPTHAARIRIPVQFYLMAMFFVIFDLEAAFIFAWAIAVREAGWLGFSEMAIFIGILFIALVYLWRIGALDWGPRLERVRNRRKASQRSSLHSIHQQT